MNQIICYNHYVYTKQLNLNLDNMNNSCEKLRTIVKENFVGLPPTYLGEGTETTYAHPYYNVFLYGFDGFYELYQEIKTMLYEVNDFRDQKYYIQCWMNHFQRGEYMSWHNHWPEEKNWHGYFCVNTEPSVTSYDLENSKIIFDVEDKNNLLVMSKNHNDYHRTYPWEFDYPRITLAFDIIPQAVVKHLKNLNHWVPL